MEEGEKHTRQVYTKRKKGGLETRFLSSCYRPLSNPGRLPPPLVLPRPQRTALPPASLQQLPRLVSPAGREADDKGGLERRSPGQVLQDLFLDETGHAGPAKGAGRGVSSPPSAPSFLASPAGAVAAAASCHHRSFSPPLPPSDSARIPATTAAKSSTTTERPRPLGERLVRTRRCDSALY